MLLRHASAAPRLFPPVAPGFCEAHGVNPATPPERLFSHAVHQISRFKLWSGRRLSASGGVARVIATHRDAMRAELTGKWASARFIWQETSKQLGRLRQDHWQASAEACGFAGSSDEWRQRIATEVLMDTHAALYHGYVENGSNRALYHLGRLEALADQCGLTAQQKRDLLEPAMGERIRMLRESGDLDGAISQAWDLLAMEPGQLSRQEEYVGLVVQQATAGLSAQTGSTGPQDAQRVEAGIDRLNETIRKFPRCAYAYGAVAALYRIRAVQLANAGRLSRALLSIGKARSHQLDMEGLNDDEAKLTDMMTQLRLEMGKVNERLRGDSSLGLNPEGERLRQEAEVGFSLLATYRNSREETETRANANNAQAFHVWTLAGLPDPPDRWAERSHALVRALGDLPATGDTDEKELRRRWLAIAQKDPDLQSVPFQNVHRLLLGAPAADDPAPSSEPDTTLRLPVAAAEVRSPDEPFPYWVLSRRNPALKMLASAAVVMLVTAGAATVKARAESERRDSAWLAMMMASGRGDTEAIITEAERFFSADPPDADARTARARQLYEAALLRWFSALPSQPDVQAQTRLKRYRDLPAAQ